MPIFLTLLYLVIFATVVKLLSKREGYFSTLTVFGIGCYIYYIGIPFELHLLSIDEINAGKFILSLSTAQLSQIIIMGTMAFSAFSIGYYLSSFNPLKIRGKFQTRLSRIPYSLRIVFIGALITILIFFYKSLLAVNTYEGAYGIRYSNPVFSLLCGYTVLYGAVIASAIILRDKNLRSKAFGIGLILLIISWGIYSSDKNVILIGLLAVAAAYSNVIKKQSVTFLIIIFTGCVILIYLIKVFSFYRGGWDLYVAFYMAVKNFGIRYVDPLGPFISLQYILNNCSELQYGQTYLHIFYLIIPRFLWKGRPLDLSEQFAQNMISDWHPGQGLGYSPLAEAYLNFSWLGPVIQYFLLGLLWGYFWKFLRKILWKYPQEIWQSLYYVLGYYLLILMHRGPVVGLMKSIILYVFPLILLVISIDLGILHPSHLKKRALISSTGRTLNGKGCKKN